MLRIVNPAPIKRRVVYSTVTVKPPEEIKPLIVGFTIGYDAKISK